MKCPHCNKRIKNDFEIPCINVENYGSNTFHFRCCYCKKIYSLSFYRKVIIDTKSIEKSNQNYTDFGG